MRYRPGLITLAVIIVILVAVIIMADDPHNKGPRKEPTCIDCVAWCAPFKVTKCIPSGLGPKCECAP